MGESDEKNPFSRNSPEIKPLRELVEQQTHKTLILWTLDCAPRFVELFEKYYPTDPRPRECLELGRLWSRGEVKMPEAKKAILAAHHAATAAEENPTAQAAARAVGHAVATVHVETHALGLVFYGLTALIYEEQPTKLNLWKLSLLISTKNYFICRIMIWQKLLNRGLPF